MARKSATFITCDGIDCDHVVELTNDGTPDGWLSVRIAKDGAYGSIGFEFHSLRCAEKWAQARRRALAGTAPTTRSSQRASRAELSRVPQVLEVFATMDQPVGRLEIATLTGLDKSSVNRIVNELIAAQTIVQVQERRGPFGAKYRLAEEAQAA